MILVCSSLKVRFFSDLKIEVTLANFSFSGKSPSFIELPKNPNKGFFDMVLYLVYHVSISLKPGALLIFNDLNASKDLSSVKDFSSNCVFALLM